MMRDKLGFFAVVAAFVGVVVASFAKDKLSSKLGQIGVQGEIAALQTQVASLFSTVRKISSLLGRALKHILRDIIHLRFLHLWRDYLALKDKLKAWFNKHLKWLLEFRKRFDAWYRRTIIPILNLIHRIRAILQIFRILHLKFAEKLDGLLGRLEAKIIKNTLVLRKKINEIASIIELILDPSVLLRNNPLFRQFLRGLDTTLHAIFGVSLIDMFPTKGGEVGPLTELGSQKEKARSVVKDAQNPRTAVGFAAKQNAEFYQLVIKDINL
jgi:hypothetical protein